ncbi:MAG: radical SAM protein [Anaerococcus sp.]|nr:radical SAM protein [Anaerococcus sp.]
MCHNYLVEKNIKDKKYLFDLKNMLLFDITIGFDEQLYKDILSKTKNSNKLNSDTLPKIVLNISNTCNYNCLYCYASHGNYGRNDSLMSLDTLNNIMSELKSHGIKKIGVVELFGGEPTLNPNLIEMVEKLSNSFYIGEFIITSNGSGNKEVVQALSKYPIKYYISLDGPKEINDKLRGEGSFDTAMNFIMFLKKSNSNFTVATTYTKLHEDLGIEYEDLYEFAQEYDLALRISTVISDNKLIKSNRLISSKMLSEELDRTIDNIYTGEKEINLDPFIMRILKSLFLSTQSGYFCDDLDTKVSIHFDYDGSVYNCFKLWKDNRFKLNNIESRNEILDTFNNKDNFKLCKNCWAKYICEMCIADTFLGKEEFPFLGNKCFKKNRYDLALEKVLETVADGRIKKIRDNFTKYL